MRADSEIIADKNYRDEMARYILPSVVIATAATPDGELHKGADRSIHHDYWIVQFDSSANEQNIECRLSFNPVIGFGGRRLADPEFRPDYAVKKVIFLTGLAGTHKQHITSRIHCLHRSRQYDWFVRWKTAEGIKRNEDLTPEHFEKYLDAVRRGEILELVPMESRISKLVKKVRYGIVNPSDFLYREGTRRAGRSPLNWDALSSHLGVTSLSITRSAEFKLVLFDAFSGLEDDCSATIARSIQLTEQPKQSDRAISAAKNHLNVWQTLHRLSTSGALTTNTLTFHPFAKKSARKVSRQISKRVAKRTPTIMPHDFFRLVTAATQWFFDNHEYIEFAVNTLRKEVQIPWYMVEKRRKVEKRFDRKRPEGAPKLYAAWVVTPRYVGFEPDRMSISYAIRMLMSACMIIIGCYSPRRGGEIAKLQVGCVEQTGPGVHLLHAFIGKTFRGIAGVPIPEVVRYAVEVMERLGSRPKSDPVAQMLFKIRKVKGFIESDVTTNIREFVKYIKLPAPDDADEWNIAAHQLRRGHAIFLHYGDEWSTLDDVSYALMHYDSEMSRTYISEVVPGEILRLQDELRADRVIDRENETPEHRAWKLETTEHLRSLVELKEEFSEVRLEAYVYKMMRLYDGTDHAIGGYAARIYADIDAIAELARADVRVVSRGNDPGLFTEALGTRMRTHATDHYLEPTPGGGAHCGARPDNEEDLAIAECLKVKATVPAEFVEGAPKVIRKVDLAFSSALPCLRCGLCVLLESNQKMHEKKLGALEDSVARAPTPAAREDRNSAYLNYRDAYLKVKRAGGRAAT